MKILHTVGSLNPDSGGPARSVPQLALALARCGHDVGLWAPGGNAAHCLADVNPEEAEQISILSGSFPQALETFGRPDLVHDHGIWLPTNRQVAAFCRAQSLPRIVSPRGMLEPWALQHKKWKKRAAWWAYQRRDLRSAVGLHATAGSEAEQFRNLGLTMPILVAPNGVGRAGTEAGHSHQPASIQRAETVEQVQDSEVLVQSASYRTALFLSRIHPKKGLPMLVDAWAKIRPTGWKMRVVGPDEDGHLAEVRSRVHRAGLESDFFFESPLEGVAKMQAYQDADLFILPTYSENFGIVVAEALLAGVPVITTTGAPWKLLIEEDCGWWVEPKLDALCRALAQATSLSDQERHEMGQRGARISAERFGWDKIAREISGAYQWFLQQGPKPDCIRS